MNINSNIKNIFLGFDWEGLLAQKVVAPHVPDIKVSNSYFFRYPESPKYFHLDLKLPNIVNFRILENFERVLH